MSIYRGKSAKEFYLASLLYDSIEDQNIRDVTALISTKKADANIVLPKKGISPFHLAVGSDNSQFALEVTTLILQHGGNPNLLSDDGLTPLHIAAAWGQIAIADLLLLSGADPDIRDINDKTAKDYAYEENHGDVLLLLDSYAPNQHDVLNRERASYNLTLDKIYIDDGKTIHEYGIGDNSDTTALQNLPKTNAQEYVREWCNGQNNPSICGSLPAISCNDGDESDCLGSSLQESLESEPKMLNFENVTCRAINRKTFEDSSCLEQAEPKCRKLSRESGILTLPDSVLDDCSELDENYKINTKTNDAQTKNTLSDYFTCGSDRSDILNRCIIETSSFANETSECTGVYFDSTAKSEGKTSEVQIADQNQSNDSDLTFVTVSEVYKYTDEEQGVVLYERRLLKSPPSTLSESLRSLHISGAQSPPPTLDYDTETLRTELTTMGFSPGPITHTTKQVYIRKLRELKRDSFQVHRRPEAIAQQSESKRVYSLELEKTLRDSTWREDLTPYKNLEEAVTLQFSSPDPSRKWREGVNKSSFTYLLLDPRITKNLPRRSETMDFKDTWETFLSSVFYVGKGKRSRPYSHLYEAVDVWRKGSPASTKKIRKILDVWGDNYGVICLHLYQNTIPVEAYTREAAMISALDLNNVSNAKTGDFYGVCASWPMRDKRRLGVYLLYKALMIFLHEGERQLCPGDID